MFERFKYLNNLKMDFVQNIFFTDDKDYTIEVLGREVNVNCSAGTHNHGSSKVKLTNVVDYNWELRFHVGQLLAVHLNGKVIAYGIKGKKGGMVRIANLETNKRALIKEMNGLMQDISFALIPQQIILGFVDEQGSLFVYSIDDKSEIINCNPLMCIVHPHSQASNYRLVWCPYIPSYGENSDTLDDPAKLLLLINGPTVEVWDVSIINSQYGNQAIQPSKHYEGFVEISGHDLNVVDASFSPDGTAIATAGMDGYVKFFQVYMVENEEPKCLHQWNPHNGAALSCLLFLDNMHTYGPESKFWKFAVTGSNYNTELKLWSCETWVCLHTIRFIPNINSVSPQLAIKVHLDTAGQYLLLSDINNRILYVLQLDKNDSQRVATISTISEFLLPTPFLSFCIRSAEVCKLRYTGSSEDLNLGEPDEEEDENNVDAVVIKMHVIQPKKLQDCTITFNLPNTQEPEPKNLFSLDAASDTLINLNEPKSDDEQETETQNQDLSKLNDLQSSVNYLLQQQNNQVPLNLMTPDAFTSPVHSSSPGSKRNHLSELISPSNKLEKHPNEIKTENLMDADNIIQIERSKDNFASAGSSPSREVQEILSFKNSEAEYFENIKQMEKNMVKIDDLKIESQNGFSKGVEDFPFSDNSDVIWPNIPIIKPEEMVKEEPRKMASNSNDVSSNEAWDNCHSQAVYARLKNLEDLVREQNMQIQGFQHDLKSLAVDFKNDLKDEVRGVYAKELEMALSRSHIQQVKFFENYVNIQKSMEREHQDNLLASTSQVLTKQISDKLQVIINHEMKSSVIPAVLSSFDTLKHQLFLEYSQKLSTTDHLLKDNISKLVTSKAVIDTLSTSIANIIKPSLETCYKEMIATTLIPSWERICGTMFQQINETFLKGTKEYTVSVESYMDKQKSVQDKGKHLVTQMQTISENIKTNMEKLNTTVAQDIERQINLSLVSMQERLTHVLANLVGEQVKLGFKNHASIFEDSVIHAVRSRAVTPSPHIIDTQVQLAQIQQLLVKGQIDAAFQQALSAADLSLVVLVCEKINPTEVFKPGNCLLPQPVILSLIQQLSADLGRNTELKLKYLEEAVLNLETTNALTKEHMPVVLRELLTQLNNFILTNHVHKCIRNMKMLQMAVQSLLRP